MQKIHFVGIKGSGTSALAQIYARMGMNVTGSDSSDVFFTDALLQGAGITHIVTPSADNVTDVDMVCHSPAYGDDHIEIKVAKEKGIPVRTYPEQLGQLMNDKQTILVSGTHGKTTTTSMISNLLLKTGLDPMVVIGSKNYDIGSNSRFGDGYLVAEACEYRRSFHNYNPTIAIVNNIDFDHPDYFHDLEDVFSAFQTFVDKVPATGALVAWGDQELCRKLQTVGRTMFFGMETDNDIYATDVEESRGRLKFRVWERGAELGVIEVRALGHHNVLNVLASVCVSRLLQVPFTDVQAAFGEFSGVYRRFDYLGQFDGLELYDDYAHHPNEIETTLRATKLSFPEDTLLTVFQPHTISRTKKFLEDFAQALTLSDEVMLVKIFQSAREQGDDAQALTSELAEQIRSRGKKVIVVNNLEEGADWIRREKSSRRGLILTMGAGDVRGIAEQLLSVKA
ncbi:UDP-N-acetylmuramate--L-alanine ligase [Tumebacillus permanentifrigoris]|uniref:UDP-N-acetylmuramate--L-alanine ligase n=1 Tax=Tumebacillus permanentifrigoris TaxID=378543 RepID=A0A316DVQ2_9BACL|nr:UDP-N-acetylmuramate--L-alanine ligase [Tumebacillus permanentifrigoris]PWK13425.1 UDP-N-acetylmuramate--L-alanine ligase [Tumebacillus permanentifrigoris]